MLRRIHSNVCLEGISEKLIFFVVACHLYFPYMILIFFSLSLNLSLKYLRSKTECLIYCDNINLFSSSELIGSTQKFIKVSNPPQGYIDQWLSKECVA
jgi:hypothetical protein